jgi:hypothetical protein
VLDELNGIATSVGGCSLDQALAGLDLAEWPTR